MRIIAAGLAAALASACAQAQDTPPPVIDMHLHAESVATYGPPGQMFCMEMLAHVPPHDPADGPWPQRAVAFQQDPGCPDPIPPAADDDALMTETLAALERLNVTGVISGPPDIVARWKAAAPDRIIAGRQFNLARDAEITPEALAAEHEAGGFEVLAEVTNQYAGFGPDAPEFEAYWALAEERDIPVGIHMGTMPPGAAYIFGTARVAIGDPLLLEEVLVRHPNLRVWVMHAGAPYFDFMIALMQAYPQLYAGTGVLQTVMTEEGYEDMLERFVHAGLERRLMYGTDQMIWPGMIERAIARVRESEVLTEEQKRLVLHDNAARFLRLDAE